MRIILCLACGSREGIYNAGAMRKLRASPLKRDNINRCAGAMHEVRSVGEGNPMSDFEKSLSHLIFSHGREM